MVLVVCTNFMALAEHIEIINNYCISLENVETGMKLQNAKNLLDVDSFMVFWRTFISRSSSCKE